MERNEAIEVIKKNYPHVAESGSQFETALRILIPELKESEDEITKKELIDFVKSRLAGFPDCKRFTDWIEKQGSEPNWCHHKVDLSNCSEEYRKAYYDGWNNCNMQHSQCKSEGNDVVKCLINGMKFYYEDNEEATWGTEKFSMKVKDILSWLEKQGEHNNFRNNIQIGDKVTRNKDGVLVNLSQLKRVAKPNESKQGEQKPTDKVEPKFKHGDRVRNKKSGLEQILGSCIEDVYEGAFPFRIKDQDNWELVEQKPAKWSEEDERIINGLISICDKAQDNIPRLSVRFSHVEALKNWLTSLKDRVQPQQEWSEDDEEHIYTISNILEDRKNQQTEVGIKILDKEIDWLKSLRPQKQ